MTSPTAPPMLPQYLADGFPKQDDETLREITIYVNELLTAREHRREHPISEETPPNDAEVIDQESNGTFYIEHPTCGDETYSCMSGGERH